jgi:hypothetical protein
LLHERPYLDSFDAKKSFHHSKLDTNLTIKGIVKTMSWIPLPEGGNIVELHLLDGGSFTADYALLHAGVENEAFRMYNFAFHIFHAPTGRHVLWDLGCTDVCFHHSKIEGKRS